MGFDEENRSYNDLLDAKQYISELEPTVQQLREENAALKEQVRRLTQPVSDEECGRYGLLAYWDRPCEQAMNVEKLIAARSK